jgi:PAS domain S-box-containing protein
MHRIISNTPPAVRAFSACWASCQKASNDIPGILPPVPRQPAPDRGARMSSRFTLPPRTNAPTALPGKRLNSAYLPWIGLSLLALLLALSAALAITQRQHIIESERNNAVLLARMLEEQASRHLDAAELVLDNIGAQVKLNIAPQMVALNPALLDASHGTPLLRSLSVVDERGLILASSAAENRRLRIDLEKIGRPRQPGQSRLGNWLAGRDLVPAGAPGDRPSGNSSSTPEPIQPGVGLVAMTRTATSADGQTLYMVAALHTEFLAKQFESTLKDSGHNATLLNYQGMVVATTVTRRIEPGDVVAMNPDLLNLLPREGHGSYEGAGLDGVDVVAAFRAVRVHPWVVLVERPASAIVASWRSDMTWLVLATLFLGALIAAATGLAWRTLRTHEQLEDALATAKQRLEENERALRSVIEAAPAPMFVLDALGHYAMVNHAFEDFLGIQRSAIIGTGLPLATHLQQLAYHPAHDVSIWQGSGRSHYLEDLPGADGRLREALVSKVSIPREDGRPRAVIGSITDVTELREAERHTREAMQIAQQASESKNEFIANMSHGLRTPLQSVLGFAELGKWRSAEQRPLQEMFSDIHAAGKRMLLLVNDLLDMSKLESTVGTMHRDLADAVSLTRELINEFQPHCTSHGVTMRQFDLLEDGSSSANGDGTIWVDRLRLQQALRNVLENALRFSPAGTAIDIELTRSADGHLNWNIRDRGPGIPESERPYLFEAFFHGHRNRDDGGGFGLGLAITSKILHAHGGSAWAENHPDGGAVFHLRMPSGTDTSKSNPSSSNVDITAV